MKHKFSGWARRPKRNVYHNVKQSRYHDYNGLLEITEILIVSDVFFELRFHQIVFCLEFTPDPAEELIDALQTVNHAYRPGREGNIPAARETPSHPTSYLASNLPLGPGVVECVGPTRRLIRIWSGTQAGQRSCPRETVHPLTHEIPDFITPDLWPANSPDLNPVDFQIWGKLQEIRDVDQLKVKPDRRVGTFPPGGHR